MARVTDAQGETEPGCPAAGSRALPPCPAPAGCAAVPAGAATPLARENRDVRPATEEPGCSLSTLNFCQQLLFPAMTKFTFPYLLRLSRPCVSFHFLTALTYPPGSAAR